MYCTVYEKFVNLPLDSTFAHPLLEIELSGKLGHREFFID
jgi:hypothetical protein